ncbi:MAG: hypothetical protein J6S67_08110 [Methanobrevibacter sp.]|nr:hypothetical protein [Methanobrevibacter sp.]
MKFNIERTSSTLYNHKKPINDVRVKEVGAVYDILDYPNKDKIWSKIYTIEINSLEELVELVNTYGKIIIGENLKERGQYDYLDPQPYTEKYFLEIYDDWRE